MTTNKVEFIAQMSFMTTTELRKTADYPLRHLDTVEKWIKHYTENLTAREIAEQYASFMC